MYAQQARTGVPELDAVLATAQMVTPEQTPTVAAQVAQAAQQKLSPPTTPPGIGALMPGVRQQAVNAAQAAQPVTQAQVQQMMQQAMQPQPFGIERLSTQNMQDMQRMAEGGVVGYAGKEGSYVDPQFPSVYENYVEPTREARTGREEDELFGPMKSERQRVIEAVAEELLGPMTKERLAAAPQRQTQQRSEATPAPRPPAPRPPAPRPPAPAPAATPVTGIAALAGRPTYDTAGIAAAGAPYMTAGEGDVKRMREAEGKRAEFEKTLPDLSAKGIEALRQRMADVEGAEASRKERFGLDRVIQQLLGGMQGAGGAARADIQFMNAQNAAADAFSQARLGNQQAQLLLEKAQQERQLGRFDRAIALEKEAAALMEKARDNALKAKDLAQRDAGAQYEGAVKLRGQDITAQTAAEDRANALKIANIRSTAGEAKGALTPRDIARFRAQAEKDVDAQLGKDPRYVSMKVRDPVGAETYRTKIVDERLKRVLAEEGYGAAAPAPAGAPATGVSPELLSQFKVRPVGQ